MLINKFNKNLKIIHNFNPKNYITLLRINFMNEQIILFDFTL